MREGDFGGRPPGSGMDAWGMGDKGNTDEGTQERGQKDATKLNCEDFYNGKMGIRNSKREKAGIAGQTLPKKTNGPMGSAVEQRLGEEADTKKAKRSEKWGPERKIPSKVLGQECKEKNCGEKKELLL